MSSRPIRVLAITFTLSSVQLAFPASSVLEAQAPLRAPRIVVIDPAGALAGAIRGFFERYPPGGP